METSDQLGPLNKDRINALKQETSIVSPETENTYYKPVVRSTVDFMMNNFGHFMREDIREKTKGLEDRLIITNPSGMNKILQEALKGGRTRGYKGVAEPSAFTFLREGVMVLCSTEDQWEKIYTEEERQALVQSAGRNEDEVRRYFGMLTLSAATIHETLHQFHDPRLPYNFAEFGITFYQGRIISQLGLPDLQSSKTVYMLRGLYAHLIERFGDDIHKVFFNLDSDITPDNKILIGEAMKKVTDDILGKNE